MKPRILVVDDEPEAVELIEFNLKQSGYTVSTAAEGAEALKKARAQVPDLIVLDTSILIDDLRTGCHADVGCPRSRF